MNRKAAVIWVLASLLIVSTAGCLNRSNSGEIDEIDLNNSILISDNSGFTSENGVTKGEGTEKNPFIIEGIEADASGSQYCVLIKDTDAHFIIRNCTFKNASTPMCGDRIWPQENWYGESGIIFDDVSNALLDHNVITSNQGGGILLRNSSSIRIMENDIIGNRGNGILIEEGSEDLEIDRNNISLNSNYGLFVLDSGDIKVLSNSFLENFGGICVDEIRDMEVEDNDLSHHTIGDLSVTSSIGMRIAFNSIGSSMLDGVTVSDSEDLRFEDNMFANTGLKMDGCRKSTLSNNTFNGIGIIVDGDSEDHFDSHTIDNNNIVGPKPIIYLSKLDHATIPTNIGQLIIASSSNLFIHSVILKTDVLIAFSESIHISGCSFSSVYGSGLELVNSNRINIEGNLFEENHLYGVCVRNSSGNMIYDNQFTLNGNNTNGGGIGLLDWSSNNEIRGNRIENNNWNGIYFQRAVNNSVIQNTISHQYFGLNIDVESNGNTMAWNDIEENNVGIINRDSSGNQFENNTCCNNDWIGMILRNSQGCILSNNSFNDNGEGIWIDEADFNILTGNQFDGNGYDTNCDGIGVKIERSSSNVLSENTCNLNNGDGIWLRDQCTNNLLESNTVCYNWGSGIDIFISSSWNEVFNNTCNENERGIVIQGSHGNDIFNNFCSNNSNCGICVSFQSENNKIRKNRCSNGSFYGIEIYSSKENEIIDNICLFFKVGIRLSDSDGCTIQGNICEWNNNSGIMVYYSLDCVILENVISRNPFGLYFYNSSGNMAHHNIFLKNSLHAFSNMDNEWDDGLKEGNFWDDYSGLDNGTDGRTAGDGIGDTDLPHIGFDYYPLMESR